MLYLTSRWLKDEESGMVVLQINQLTAYSPLTDTIISSSTKSGVKRYEIDDRTLTLYLDEVPFLALLVFVTPNMILCFSQLYHHGNIQFLQNP